MKDFKQKFDDAINSLRRLREEDADEYRTLLALTEFEDEDCSHIENWDSSIGSCWPVQDWEMSNC